MQAAAALPGAMVSVLSEHNKSETTSRDPLKSSRRVLVTEHPLVCKDPLPNKAACRQARLKPWKLP